MPAAVESRVDGISRPGSPSPAGLIRRLAAVIYESLLLGAIALLIGFASLPFALPTDASPSGPVPLPPSGQRVGLLIALFVGWGAYCVWSWSGSRRTLAMKAWHLALQSRSGSPPSRRQALIRYLGAWLGPVCAIAAYAALRPIGLGAWALLLLGFNYAWGLIGADRQFLHDRIAGTRVVAG